MRHLLNLLIAILFYFPLISQSEVRIETNITDAKVFLKGANLTRTSSFTIPAGKSTVILEKLPTDLKFNSIKLNLGESVVIQNIAQRTNFLKAMDVSDQTLTITHKRDSLDLVIQYLNLDLSIANSKVSLITSNTNFNQEGSSNVNQEVRSYLTLYDEELLKHKRKALDIKLEIDELKKERSILGRELSKIKSVKEVPSLELVVEVTTEKPVKGDVSLEYYTPNASWFPKYSARVQSVEGTLDLGLKALIVQSTPEPWNDVKIILSNVQPDFEGTLPELDKWELTYKRLTQVRSNFGNAPVNKVSGVIQDSDGMPLIGASIVVQGTTLGTISDIDGFYELSVPNKNSSIEISYVGYQSKTIPVNRTIINVILDESDMILDEVVVTGYAVSSRLAGRVAGVQIKEKKTVKFATVEERQNAIEYVIIERQNISNEGESKLIDVQEYELEASFEHHTIPKLKPDVYIQALVSNWDDYYFLNGEMNIYFENSFVGKSLLETNVYSDTLFLSLGKDYNVSVERKPVKSSSKKQFFGNNKLVTKSFQINVKNQKKEAIELFVHDQIPVSIINTVDVELLESGNATLDPSTGELLWRNTVDSKANGSYNFTYKVKFPKGEEVILE